MRLRFLVPVLIAGVVLVPAPVHAATSCPEPYPAPVLSLQRSTMGIERGQTVRFGGYLARNGCGIADAKVGLFAREAGTDGPFVYQRETRTGAAGQYLFDLAPRRPIEAMAVFSGTPREQRARSRALTVHVWPYIEGQAGFFPFPSCFPVSRVNGAPLPEGLTVVTKLSKASVAAGEDLQFEVELTNRGRQEIAFVEHSPGRIAVLRNPANGEIVNGSYDSDGLSEFNRKIAPGERLTLPSAARTRSCDRGQWDSPAAPGTYDLLVALEVHHGDATGYQDRVLWAAEPVTVTVTPPPVDSTPPAPDAEKCPTPYPDPALRMSPTSWQLPPGKAVDLYGTLKRNACPVRNAAVGLFIRYGSSGRFTYAAQTRTDSLGRYLVEWRAHRTFEALMVFSGRAGLARAESQVRRVVATTTPVKEYGQTVGCFVAVDGPEAFELRPPPPSTTFSLVPARNTVWDGQVLPVDMILRNDASSNQSFQQTKEQWHIAFRNVRNGEVVGGSGGPGGPWQNPVFTLAPGQSHRFRASPLTTTCAEPSLATPIRVGRYELLGGTTYLRGESYWHPTAVSTYSVAID